MFLTFPRRSLAPRALRVHPAGILGLAGLVIALAAAACGRAPTELVCAAGTTLVDAGALERPLRAFTERTGIRVSLVGVTSAEGFRLGAAGSADVLVTFDPEGEEAFAASGRALGLYPYLPNHYVLAGPVEDPAGIRGRTVVDAMRRLVTHAFVSRDDGSGTHKRERLLWSAAGVKPRAVVAAGAGAGATLRIADERNAYTLTDAITLRAFEPSVRIRALVDADTMLEARYTVVLVRQEGTDAASLARQSAANQLVDWLLRDAAAIAASSGASPAGAAP